MKQLFTVIAISLLLAPCFTQKLIKEESIRYQQERMGFESVLMVFYCSEADSKKRIKDPAHTAQHIVLLVWLFN